MTGSNYIHDTSHTENLVGTMNGFHRALTRRWREVVGDAIVADNRDFLIHIRRSVSPYDSAPLWDYQSLPARSHIGFDYCAYVAWLQGGQKQSFNQVVCDGRTGVDRNTEMVDRHGEMVIVPPHIECGVGSILAQVEDWAWGERDAIFYRLPMFDRHDMKKLEEAYKSLEEMRDTLNLDAPPNPDSLPDMVDTLAGESARGQDWWAGWTGLQASLARSGFFASVKPTCFYQVQIIAKLANLYVMRGLIVEKGRNDALRWIEDAIGLLDDTEQVTTDLRTEWKVVQGLGMLVTTLSKWFRYGGQVGAAITLLGFLGDNLVPKPNTHEEYVASIEDVVTK